MTRIGTLLLTALALSLAGCANVARTVNENVTFTDAAWAKSQKNNNVQAIVDRDEVYDFYAMLSIETMAGVGPAERRYRRVSLFMTHSDGGRPFLGFKGFIRYVAIVPDGMPMLKAGDLVEVRYGSLYDHLKGFATTGEGSAVLRLLCPGDVNDKVGAFHKCASSLPWHTPWGEDKRFYDGIAASPSGRPYAASLKNHTELSFTPYYDETGKPLPAAVAPGPRPFPKDWPAPKRY